MIRDRWDTTTVFRFPGLAAFADVRHAVFSRSGGESSGDFASLNVTYGIGDRDRHVAANRQQVARVLSAEHLVVARQRHGRRVAIVGDGATAPETASPPEADAMVTDRADCMLTMQVADCQPVFIYDPVRRVAANVHNGWRGSIQNILGHTVAVMRRRFGCRPSDMRAGIGPSLGPCCAEFIHYRQEIPRAFWPYKDARDHFDFWTISTDQLVAAGLPRSHVEIGGLCTRCRTDLFFSYRGEGRTGRFAAVIGLV